MADLEPGDEVVTSPFTFVATVNAALAAGGDGPLRRHRPSTFNMDPDAAAAALTERTRALVPVHLYGRPAPMDELSTLALRHDLVLVEDSAQAHGAAIGDRRTRILGSRVLLVLRHQEHDHRRGRHGHHLRRSAGRPHAGSCATRACGPATSTRSSATTGG